MYFNQFKSKLSGQGIQLSLYSYGNLLEQTTDNKVLLNGEPTDFSSLEEARQYIKQTNLAEHLEEEIAKELYSEISETKIAGIIKEHHNIKVTDTIIESYINLASSKAFTLDPVVENIRTLNKFDKLIEGKLDFELDDGSIVAINESTFDKINNILNNHHDIIEYMRTTKENFITVVEQLEE